MAEHKLKMSQKEVRGEFEEGVGGFEGGVGFTRNGSAQRF